MRALSVYMVSSERGPSAVIEYASHDALASQLFDDHSLNEGFEICTGQISADARQAARQILSQRILSRLRIMERRVLDVLCASWIELPRD